MNNALPNLVLPVHCNNGERTFMLRSTMVHRLDGTADILNPLTHASIIPKR